MTSLPVRDPLGDPLLTPEDSTLIVIDYQPSQVAAVRSMDTDLLRDNIVSTVKAAKAFAPGSSVSSRQARSRSPGSRSPSSSSATGHARRRWRTSSRSCSPSGC
jgi:hypothetical protein